jgi:hypothetical protein
VDGLAGTWFVFAPARDDFGLTPYSAATLRSGSLLRSGNATRQVTSLFQEAPLELMGIDWPGARELRYGFVARVNNDWVLMRWNERGLQALAGHELAERDSTLARAAATSAP